MSDTTTPAAPAAPAPAATLAAATPATPASPAPAAPAGAPATPATPAAPASTPQTALGAADITPPAEIKITVPEGMQFDQTVLGKFTDLAKASGLNGETAQKIFDMYVEDVKSGQAKQRQVIAQWGEEAKNDPEIGGPKFEQTLADAKRALKAFGNEDLLKFLNSTGLGNHKAVIRTFALVGKSIAEDKAPKGGDPIVDKKDLATLLYDKMGK